MSEKEVVLSREEFVSLLMERLETPSDIGKYMNFVEGVFTLQNSDDAPVYVFEIAKDSPPEMIYILDQIMRMVGISICYIPAGQMKYVATVTPVSMRIKQKIKDVRAKIKELIKLGEQAKVLEDLTHE